MVAVEQRMKNRGGPYQVFYWSDTLVIGLSILKQ